MPDGRSEARSCSGKRITATVVETLRFALGDDCERTHGVGAATPLWRLVARIFRAVVLAGSVLGVVSCTSLV